MTRRKPYLVPGQESMFELPEPTDTLESVDEQTLPQPELTVEERVQLLEPTYGRSGSYVSVEERAEYLTTALESFSARNRRKGFALAAFTAPSSKRIWGEYEENTEGVIRGARRNRFLFETLAKQSFWKATGLSAMRGTGLMRPRQIDPRGEKMWDDFYFLYSHPRRHKDRKEYIKRLKPFLPPEMPKESQVQEAA